MVETLKSSVSVYGPHTKRRKRDKILNNKFFSKKKLLIGNIIAVFLTLVAIILQFIAFFTPHWKEIIPNAHSLYVDGVDALIRTEVLHYFNSIHRYTRHSYGLFQRCEYLLNNSSKHNNHYDLLDFNINYRQKICTKNYLPSYRDDHFNECHSLSYYRFCTKKSEKIFDINNDYLRATFDISSSLKKSTTTASCDCHYPPYVLICHVIGIIGIIFLFLTCLLFSLFPFFSDLHHRLKLKCFGILSSILSIIFLLTNLIIIFQYFEYESIEYLVAIQRHYKSNQIYKLSQDTKIAVEQFLLSINIRIGYSGILAWIAFALSIINGILFLLTCRIKHNYDEQKTRTNLITSNDSEDHHLHKFQPIPDDSESLTQMQTSIKPNVDQNHLSPSNSKNEIYRPLRILRDDEV